MAVDVEGARTGFIAADNRGSTLFRGDKSSSTSNKKGINSDNYDPPNDNGHLILGSAILSSGLSGIDAKIGNELSKLIGEGNAVRLSANQIASNAKELGRNQTYRRQFLRDIPKEFRDIEVPIKLPTLLTWTRDIGALATGLTAINVALDLFDNNKWQEKAEASAIDVGATALVSKVTPKVVALATKAKGYFSNLSSEVDSVASDTTVNTAVDASTDVAVDAGTDVAVDVGADVAIGTVAVVAAPEVATAAVVVGAGVIVGFGVSLLAGKAKSLFDLN